MRPLEIVYLLLAVGVVIYAEGFKGGLDVQDVGLVMFLLGLIPVTRADATDVGSPSGELRRLIVRWLAKEPTK